MADTAGEWPPAGCTCDPPSHSGHYSYCPLVSFSGERNVLHVMERYHLQAQEASPDEIDGTVMVATDTRRKWVSRNGRWEDLAPSDQDHEENRMPENGKHDHHKVTVIEMGEMPTELLNVLAALGFPVPEAEPCKPKIRISLSVEDLVDTEATEADRANMAANMATLYAVVTAFVGDDRLVFDRFIEWARNHGFTSDNKIPHGKPGHECGRDFIGTLTPRIVMEASEYMLQSTALEADVAEAEGVQVDADRIARRHGHPRLSEDKA